MEGAYGRIRPTRPLDRCDAADQIDEVGGGSDPVDVLPAIHRPRLLRAVMRGLEAFGEELEDAGHRHPVLFHRVAVTDGHTVCASVELAQQTDPEAAEAVLREYCAPASARDLPSAPRPVIEVRSEADRPQPRLDRLAGNGMTTVVGRVRCDPILDLKFVVLSHNTIRGAAGGSIYNAELLVSEGLL